MIIVIVIMVVIALADIPPMFKARPKDIVSYAAIYVFVLTVALLFAAGVKLPSPMLVLDKIFKSIGLSY